MSPKKKDKWLILGLVSGIFLWEIGKVCLYVWIAVLIWEMVT